MTIHQKAISIFLSYAHEDEPLLRQLETHLSLLRQQGIISIWYDREIIPGTDWAKAVDTHLETASVFLLLVSPDFLASDYCYQVEMKRALERQDAGEARVIPILVRPVDGWQHTPFAYLQVLPTDGKAVTTWRNQDEAFVDVVSGIRRAIEDLSLLPASTFRAALPPIWNIPYPRNSFFIGRDDLLVRLHTQLQRGQAIALSQSPYAISGLGGIGKTQVAIEYAYRYHQDYEVVLWAQAEKQDALISSYTTIAALLRLPERNAEEQEITIGAVKAWLQTHRKWLLILDNADDLNVLTPFLPPVLGGHVLLTTRAWDMQRLAMRWEVEMLPNEQGAAFLLRRSGLLTPETDFSQAPLEDRQLATLVTQELGGLPLALDQAGAYLEATGMSLQEYQRIYQTHRQILLRERRSRVPDHPDAVATTWSLSFERVQKKNPAAAELLRLCAFLSPDAIPEEILTEGARWLGPVLAPVASDAFQRNQAIETLRAYSLVRRDLRERTLSVHRLVQVVLQDELEKVERHTWAERAMLAIHATFPYAEYGIQPQCERLLMQALTGARIIDQYQLNGWYAGHLLYALASYLQNRARYSEAEPLYQRALRIMEQSLGSDHLDVARLLRNLGVLYREQGKYTEAEPLYQRALRIREQKQGSDHPEVAHPLENLASLYMQQGKYTEAEPLCQRSLTIRQRFLGREHPLTQSTRDHYASMLRAMGRNKEAKHLEQDS